MVTRSATGGFGAFFRRYTKTWMHAVATAGLTAFGMLTFVHRGFVVLAIASYVVPPIVLYVSRTRGPDAETAATADAARSPTEAALADRSTADAGRGREPRAEPGTERGPETTSEPAPERDPESDRDPADHDPAADRESETDGEADAHWTTVEAPTDATLRDAAIADGTPVAVGDGGVVLAATDPEWEVTLADGPGAQGQDLRGVDASADGEAVWVAGDGGAVGRIDLETGRHTDYSAPDDRTDNLTGLAVSGPTDDETILLTNGSGEVIRGRYRDGDLAWEGPVTPGSGSSLSGVSLLDAATGYCCDTNDGVFRTDDGGRTWSAIGIDGADGTLTGVAAAEDGTCYVSTDAGAVHRYDGSTWTPDRVADGSLSGLASRDDRLVAIDEDGAVYDRPDPTADWDRQTTGASGPLHGVAIGPGRSIAVGAEGTVVERTGS